MTGRHLPFEYVLGYLGRRNLTVPRNTTSKCFLMVSLLIHGMLKSIGHPTYGLQHESTINLNRPTINAHQFNNQLDNRSITKGTNVHANIWTGVLHDWKRVLYQLSYQPLTASSKSLPIEEGKHLEESLGSNISWTGEQ
jgi:hypothetical protein